MNQKESLEILKKLNFCAIDLETTGGDHQKDKIFEIGLVKIKELEITEKKEFRINPEKKIPPYVQKLTSIKDADLKDEKIIEEVIDEIVDFISEDIIIAHNVAFDLPFLNSVLKRLGKKQLANKTICTNIMTKYLLPETTSSNLTFLSNLFQIEGHSAHRALSDAKLTSEILIHYLKMMSKRGFSKINQIYYPRNRFELDRVHLKDKEKALGVLEKLVGMKLNFTLSLKNKSGLLLNYIPYSYDNMNSHYLLDELNNPNVETYSFQIFGSYLRALIKFKENFLNVNLENREKTLNVLTEKISSFNSVSKPLNSSIIFVPHLMDNQYLAFDGDSLSSKKMFVFRYPGQEKKIVNSINKDFIRSSKKIGNHASHRPINKLIHQYILAEKNTDSVLYMYKKNFPKSLKFRKHDLLDQLSKLKRQHFFPSFHL